MKSNTCRPCDNNKKCWSECVEKIKEDKNLKKEKKENDT